MSKLRENLEKAKVNYLTAAMFAAFFAVGTGGFAIGTASHSNDLSKASWKRVHEHDLQVHRNIIELANRIEELEKENEDLRSLQSYEWDEGWEDAMEMMGNPPYDDGC